MSSEEPHPTGELIEAALLRIMRPDLLEQYQKEKERHREEKETIERLRQVARSNLWRWFRKGPIRERKRRELEQEYVERLHDEDDRHARFLEELREMIRDHWDAERAE